MPNLIDVVSADLRHMTANWDASRAQVLVRSIPRLALYPRFRAVVLFRVAQAAHRHRTWRWLAIWFQGRALRASGAELHPAATIGPGLALIHSSGIVVGHEVTAGRDLVLYQGVTLGHNGRSTGQPHLGDRVRVGAGAKVLGPVVIGNDVWLGANSVVRGDVPDGAVVTGVWPVPRQDRST